MAQMSNSSVFIKEEEINWNISNDFALMWNASAGKNLNSPNFQIGDKKFHLRILTAPCQGAINVDGMLVEPADSLVMLVKVVIPEEIVLMGGSLRIDMEGQKISGIFGDPTGKTIHVPTFVGHGPSVYYFKNQTSKVAFVADGNIVQTLVDSGYSFCINRHTTQIRIQVKLYGPSPITHTISREPVKDIGAARMVADLRAMLNRSAENADFNIECGGKSFPCHELILRARSTVLDAMFQNEMTETSRRSMTVVDVGPNTMVAFLEYLYTGEITAEVDNMKELIYIADKYDMEGLLEFCFGKLSEVEDHMVVDFLFMADKHNFVDFKKEAMLRINMNKSKYMEDQDFVEKLQEVPRLLLELYKL